MSDKLLVGAAEVDITPPVGTALAGDLKPRVSEGVEDPLTIKAVVLESGGVKLAYVMLDLVKFYRKEGDAAVKLASARTRIPPTHIVWSATHTHTGPYTGQPFGSEDEGAINREWLSSIPEKFAQAVEQAHESRRPARMSRERGYSLAMIHNRRLRFKGGREIGTWLLQRGEEELQCLGSVAPVDPEIGIISFDDQHGVPIAILWHFALHTNTTAGNRFSADYPGVVAGRLRERFGLSTVPIFMQGTCGDIKLAMPAMLNRYQRHRYVGDELADIIIQRMEKRKYSDKQITLGALKEEIVVPCRDFTIDQEQRIKDSQWPPEAQERFRHELELVRKQGETEVKTLIQAWRIGEIGFAGAPGELFVEWGLKIKEKSPFPWTFPVEQCGDALGYLVTEKAWKAGGYESLISRGCNISVEGVAKMVDVALKLLNRLKKQEMKNVGAKLS